MIELNRIFDICILNIYGFNLRVPTVFAIKVHSDKSLDPEDIILNFINQVFTNFKRSSALRNMMACFMNKIKPEN